MRKFPWLPASVTTGVLRKMAIVMGMPNHTVQTRRRYEGKKAGKVAVVEDHKEDARGWGKQAVVAQMELIEPMVTARGGKSTDITLW